MSGDLLSTYFIHLMDCIIESKRKLNDNDFQEFSSVIFKIIDHDEEFKPIFEKVIKYKQSIETIYDLFKKN